MKKILSTAIATTLAATGLMATTAAFTTASADMAYNAGVMSQYVFRGMVQRGGASLMGGADYTNDSGLYAGVWAAQVGTEATTSIGSNNGLEVDLYGGIKKEVGAVTLGAGFTSYQYTNQSKYNGTALNSGFDTAYNELNFSLGYGPITATINPGYHQGAGNGLSDKSYVFYSLKGEYNGFYALYGAFDKKAEAKGTSSSIPTTGASFDGYKDGSYVQAGYKTTLGGLDLDAFLVKSSKELNTVGSDAGTSDATTAVISATKAF
jgi:uncharacterized protein (TIGR02001 family)